MTKSPLTGMGFWVRVDAVGHRLPLGRRIQAWLCEKADYSLTREAPVNSTDQLENTG